VHLRQFSMIVKSCAIILEPPFFGLPK
jgi:hypothetical protein